MGVSSAEEVGSWQLAVGSCQCLEQCQCQCQCQFSEEDKEKGSSAIHDSSYADTPVRPHAGTFLPEGRYTFFAGTPTRSPHAAPILVASGISSN
jgi:hypothetical protein